TGTGTSELAADGQPDALPRAGYDGDLVVKLHASKGVRSAAALEGDLQAQPELPSGGGIVVDEVGTAGVGEAGGAVGPVEQVEGFGGERRRRSGKGEAEGHPGIHHGPPAERDRVGVVEPDAVGPTGNEAAAPGAS